MNTMSLEQLTLSLQQWLTATLGSPWDFIAQCVLVGLCAITLFALLGLLMVYLER